MRNSRVVFREKLKQETNNKDNFDTEKRSQLYKNNFKNIMMKNFRETNDIEYLFYKKVVQDMPEESDLVEQYIKKVFDLEEIFLKQNNTVQRFILREDFEEMVLGKKELKIGNFYFKIVR